MITAIEWQGRNWSQGQGIGIARHFQNAEIVSFATDGGSYRVRVRFQNSTRHEVVNVRDIGDWLTEEEIAELRKVFHAEGKAGKIDLQASICGDAGAMYDEFRQATDMLQEISDPDLAYPPIERSVSVINLAISQVEEAIQAFRDSSVDLAVLDYEQRYKAALTESV